MGDGMEEIQGVSIESLEDYTHRALTDGNALRSAWLADVASKLATQCETIVQRGQGYLDGLALIQRELDAAEEREGASIDAFKEVIDRVYPDPVRASQRIDASLSAVGIENTALTLRDRPQVFGAIANGDSPKRAGSDLEVAFRALVSRRTESNAIREHLNTLDVETIGRVREQSAAAMNALASVSAKYGKFLPSRAPASVPALSHGPGSRPPVSRQIAWLSATRLGEVRNTQLRPRDDAPHEHKDARQVPANFLEKAKFWNKVEREIRRIEELVVDPSITNRASFVRQLSDYNHAMFNAVLLKQHMNDAASTDPVSAAHDAYLYDKLEKVAVARATWLLDAGRVDNANHRHMLKLEIYPDLQAVISHGGVDAVVDRKVNELRAMKSQVEKHNTSGDLSM